MGQNSKENKILEVFYENPGRKFTVRELGRLTKMPRATVHNYLASLKKQNIISRENKAESNLLFKTKKINYFVEKIISSGLIEEIINKLNPSCIILFGSIRKGDSVKESDIDLFIESPLRKKINISTYERRLNHKLQIFIESDINKLHSNLFNNVVNGIKIYGSFKIK
ncbi:MAG: nucleotidyltransferase domain-containing protein [Nanoarchaeota archaeon]|nr:nucleotidyltransferase domain-containing protein [Nanoarchaeota archaeon]